jgi:GTPase SAR1 family protein
MSCFGGSQKKSEKQLDDDRSNKAINDQLKTDGKELKKVIKILLLGTGDCGKSTFAKQLSIINGTMSQQQLKNYSPVLKDNALSGAQTVIEYLREWEVKLPDEITKSIDAINSAAELNLEVAKHIKGFGENATVLETLTTRGAEMTLQGGVSGIKYYFANCERFATADFSPTQTDVLNARRKTTGVIETNFEIEGNVFSVVDVGGQRTERKKWLNCFSSITSVIFLAAINEYDMKLEEDDNTNRLIESLKLWKALTSTDFFRPIPFMLFLNKSDLFKEKIEQVPLNTVFPEFEKFSKNEDIKGKTYFEQGCAFFEKNYRTQFGGSGFTTHVTCAIDTESCKNVWNSVRASLLLKQMDALSV